MHSTHQAVEESLPILSKFSSSDGVDRMQETPLKNTSPKYILTFTKCQCLEESIARC